MQLRIALALVLTVASAMVQQGLRRGNPLEDMADQANELAKHMEKNVKDAHKELVGGEPASEPASEPAKPTKPVTEESPPAVASPAASPAGSPASPAASPAAPPPAEVVPAPSPAKVQVHTVKVSPAPAPAPVRLQRSPKKILQNMKASYGLPEDGYNEYSSKKLVEHEDGETATKDFRAEWPQRDETENESRERICKEQPDLKWCKMFLKSRKTPSESPNAWESFTR